MLGLRFSEEWRNQRYFVVHIPKAGGTSLFAWFRDIFGSEQCVPHIESLVLPTPTPEAVRHLLRFRVIGGHVPIGFADYFGGFNPVTVVRNPWDQFCSHVNHALTVELSDTFLQGVREKLRVSLGHFLQHASELELSFFENPQSKPIFGRSADWRTMSVAERLEWLRLNYAIATTTETMEAELTWISPPQNLAVNAFPKLNVAKYGEISWTPRQREAVEYLLREDAALHSGLRQLSVQS